LRRGRALAAFGAAVVAVGVAGEGCSLGLDASLIGADAGPLVVPPDTGVDVTPGPPPIDASHDAPAVDAADAAECADAGDCADANPCRVGRCAAGRCVFDVCPTTACQGSICSPTGCTTPAAYGFHAATVHVSAGPVGCGGDAGRCLAAAYPFAFVGTVNGVVAYAMNDPANPTPSQAQVKGLAFLPSWIVAQGSRVYFIGALAGSAPTYRLPVAWVDVPSDPLATSMRVTSVLASFGDPQLSAVFPTSEGGIFFVDASSDRFFPTALVTPPLGDGDALGFAKSPGVPSGAAMVAASGPRIVNARWADDAGAYETFFSLEKGAGTGAAQGSVEQNTFAAMGPTTSQSTYATGPNGSFLWGTGSMFVDDGGTPQIRAARMAWVLSDATTEVFDATVHADLEQYSPPVPYGTTVAGALAAVDDTQVLALATAANQLAETSVQLVLKGTPPTVAPSQRRTVIPVGVAAAGVTTSGGFGYVLANDAPDSCTLHTFAPACAGP
jgi:hypothetical protein